MLSRRAGTCLTEMAADQAGSEDGPELMSEPSSPPPRPSLLRRSITKASLEPPEPSEAPLPEAKPVNPRSSLVRGNTAGTVRGRDAENVFATLQTADDAAPARIRKAAYQCVVGKDYGVATNLLRLLLQFRPLSPKAANVASYAYTQWQNELPAAQRKPADATTTSRLHVVQLLLAEANFAPWAPLVVWLASAPGGGVDPVVLALLGAVVDRQRFDRGAEVIAFDELSRAWAARACGPGGGAARSHSPTRGDVRASLSLRAPPSLEAARALSLAARRRGRLGRGWRS